MAIVDVLDLPGVMPKGARLLGLDLGSKTIGLAISDSLFQIASPLETIRRRKFTADAESLKQIIGERN
ncbi:MAG: Holliday junction resolvase RuvX, partial [Pseudomonadota bacterium]|nr:Holliday junction resolvase RuvX [Pseudomonadota bacterium]